MIPFTPDQHERDKPIFTPDKIGICQKCEGEKFEEHEEYDYEGEKFEGMSWTCEACGQRYVEFKDPF